MPAPHERPLSRSLSRRAALAAALLVAAAALVAGCGGSSPSSTVANLGKATTSAATTPAPSAPSSGRSADFYNKALAYSQCMRAHGVADFPDPQVHGGGVSLLIRGGPGSDLNPTSAQFQSAQHACQSLAPVQGTRGTISPQMRAQALAFSACMRSHGVPNFPDPTFSGGGVRIGGGSKLGAGSPQFQSAQQACQSKLPGAPGGALSTQGAGK